MNTVKIIDVLEKANQRKWSKQRNSQEIIQENLPELKEIYFKTERAQMA